MAKSDVEALDVRVLDGNEPSFNISIKDFVGKFNAYYRADNPVDAENPEPYAVLREGDIGVTTRFAIGSSQEISIIPLTDSVLEEFENKD